jgi:hypothetical protein
MLLTIHLALVVGNEAFKVAFLDSGSGPNDAKWHGQSRSK